MKSVSASQIELFTRCNRRWAFSHRAGLKEPFAQAAQAGVETHKIIELDGPYDAEWEGYPVGQMAALLKAQAPELGAKEQRFEVEVAGVPLVGVVDGQSNDGETIIDFKTTSRVKNAKSEAKLTEDPQRLMYTQFVPTAKRTLWLYGAWDTMIVTPRQVEIDRPKDRERFKLKVLQPAEYMLGVPDDVDPLSLKPNVNDCALFPAPGGRGGCPHKSKCFPPGKLAPVITNSKESNEAMESLVERLRAKSAAAGNAPVEPQEPKPVPASVTTPPAPAPEPEPAVPTEEPKKRAPRKTKAEPEPAAPAETTSAEPPTAQPLQNIIGTLYINCLPLSGGFENASSYIAAAAQTVADDAHVPHALLIDFSRGGPAIAAQLRADLSGKRIERLYLETKSNEGRAVMNVLISIADLTIQGVF